MPFDPTVAIVFGSMLCALTLSLLYAVWYQSMKRKTSWRSAADDPSKSVSLTELEGLVKKAVSDAVKPLQARFDTLEREVRSLRVTADEESGRALTGHAETLDLDVPEDEPAAERISRRTH